MMSQSVEKLLRVNPRLTWLLMWFLMLAVAGCSGTVTPQGRETSSSNSIRTPSAIEGTRELAGAQHTIGDVQKPEIGGKARVSIDNFTFHPETLEIPAGTKVVWVNSDDVPHTVRSTEDLFRSEALDTDDQFEHLFSEPGTYEYYCGVHRHMEGRIIVK